VSGFVAVLSRRGTAVDESLLARLAAPLAAYAPNGSGAHREGPVGLAHGLLSARENAVVGPHRSSRGAWLAGDIRIDAKRELRDALTTSGAVLPGDATDEALVLAAWHAWGEDAVARLRGDFSFALWDPAQRVLLCARDAFGVRPLYYAAVDDTFVCSNVLAAVRAHPAVTSRLHEPAIVSFLCHGFNIDLTTTTFTDIRRLAPAHQLTVPRDGPVAVPRRHWSFPAPPPLVYRREEEYVERYRELLGRAVQDRLRVPRVAIMLSGGLDSTSLAATVRRLSPGTDVLAITMDVSAFTPNDDARLGAEVARRLGLRHEITGEAPEQLGHVRDAAFRSPEPLDEPEYSEWRGIAARISVETPVVFVGEDGDALFEPPGLLTMLRTWPAADVFSRVVRYTISHGRHPHTGLWLRRRLREFGKPKPPPVPPWMRREAIARAGLPQAPFVPRHPTRPLAQELLLGPVWQSLLETYEVAYSGAPLEARWPLLDTRLLEFALAIPPVPWCQRKEIVRVAFRDELPAGVLRRPKTTLRGYDEAQVASWRAARSCERLALSSRTLEFVDGDRVLDQLTRGSATGTLCAWRVLALDRWLRDL
jgi:asparagine synthase (glutamine-hydrolysing)